jgi:antitoxin CptB
MYDKLENLKKKILYRSSYRGTKEMDILLTSFVKRYVNKLNKEELNDLLFFLNLEDEIIFNFYRNGNKANLISENRISTLFRDFKI